MASELTQLQKAQAEEIFGPEFQTLLSHYWSRSEEKRSHAKSMMKQKDPESLALNLAYYLRPDSIHGVYYRQMCAELLRMLLTDDDDDDDFLTWRNLSVSTQSNIKSILLDRMKLEQESDFIIFELRKAVSKLAALLLPLNNWPELLPFLYQCVSTDFSSNNYLKGSGFWILGELSEAIGETLVPFVKTLHLLFRRTLNGDTLELDVRIAAAIAAITFIQYIPASLNEKERFQDLLAGVLRTLTDSLSSNEETAAQQIVKHFNALAKNEPRCLRSQLVDVVNSMLEIAEDKSLKEDTRFVAVEFLFTLVEAREKAPGMIKKVPRFTSNFFALLLDLLLDIKDEPSWYRAENLIDQAGKTRSYILGEKWLGRFSIALGGKTVTPIAKEQLGDYLVSCDWEKRHAALTALPQISQCCSKVMVKYMEQVVDMVLPSLQDPHRRVRWAAINAIKQLSIDFCPYFQKQYHNQVLPALAAAMDDFQNPRLQDLAASALVDFCRCQKLDILVPYLDGMLNKLIVLLQNGNQMVQEEALAALSFIALVTKEHFQKYYDFVMPYMKTILVNANDRSNHTLQSKVLGFISYVGTAVGKEKFRNDLKQVMEMLMSIQKSQEKELDTILYILMASRTICKCMGKDFLPYMSTFMPTLVAFAQLEPDKTVSSDELDNSIHKVKFGDEIICASGWVLLEGKAYACFTLGYYAKILEEDFYPWISQVTSILVPLLKFYIQRNVRGDAISAMYPLLRSAKLAVDKGIAGGNKSYFKQLSSDIIMAMGDALYSEPETQLCAGLLRELNMCLEIYRSLLNDDQVHSIIDGIKHVITESSNRRRKLKDRAKLEDFDAEEDELLMEEKKQEDNIVRGIGDVLVTLIKTFKAAFLPFFDELSPYLISMWGKDTTAQQRITSSFIFDHFLKECPEVALKYCDLFLPLLLDASNDENPAVRQNALYALGLCAEYGGSVLKPFVSEAISRINVVIMHFRALEPKNVFAYDNAVCTLGKICQFHRDSIDSVQVIPIWLNCLPIKADLDEAKYVHNELCLMVERLDRELMGPNYQNLPKIVSVFAEVLCSEKALATEETINRIINVLRHLQQTLPPTTLESTLTNLLPQQEMELKSILSLEEDDNL